MICRLTLASGRTVNLEALHIEPTYAGLLEGKPTPEYIDRLLTQKPNRLMPTWGKRSTHLLRPTPSLVVNEGGKSREHFNLPPLTFHAWFTSNATDNISSGSELILVWFGSLEQHADILDLVRRAVVDVPWEKIAGNFDY